MPTVPISSNTLGQMKADVADQLARTDLTAQIASAIAESIDFYETERFFWSESRDITFTTVGGQDIYTAADNAAIPTLISFDYIMLYLGSVAWPITRRTPEEIEILNQDGISAGQPFNWTYYNQSLRVAPIPDTSYLIRIAAQRTVAGPANDTETGNPWMTYGESLIRARTKYLLNRDVIKDYEEASAMASAVNEAFDNLKARTNKITGSRIFAPMQF